MPGAFLAGLIFALHPVNVESVAWISQRKDMMAVLFFLMSILWYIQFGNRASASRQTTTYHIRPLQLYYWYWLSLAAFILAMLSKGSVAVLPIVLLGINLVDTRQCSEVGPTGCLRRFCGRRVVYANEYMVPNAWFRRKSFEMPVLRSGYWGGGVVWFYLYKAFLPCNLAFVYPQLQIKADNLLWWLPLSAAIAVTIVLWLYRKSWSRPLLFAWGFFCVALVPVLGFTDIYFMRYSLVADHYQHIALIGVAALAAAAFSACASVPGRKLAGWRSPSPSSR